MHPSMPVDEARAVLDRLGVAVRERAGARASSSNEVYDETVEPTLVGPTFVHRPPARGLAARPRRTATTRRYVERFELVVAGRELANAYSELNDPVDQRARVRGRGARPRPAATPRRATSTRTTCARSSTGCRRRAGSASGIDRLVMLLAGVDSHPRGDPVPDAAPGVRPTAGRWARAGRRARWRRPRRGRGQRRPVRARRRRRAAPVGRRPADMAPSRTRSRRPSAGAAAPARRRDDRRAHRAVRRAAAAQHDPVRALAVRHGGTPTSGRCGCRSPATSCR